MQKAQTLYWDLDSEDVIGKITLPAFALTISREHPYKPEGTPIPIPNMNEENLIRRGRRPC